MYLNVIFVNRQKVDELEAITIAMWPDLLFFCRYGNTETTLGTASEEERILWKQEMPLERIPKRPPRRKQQEQRRSRSQLTHYLHIASFPSSSLFPEKEIWNLCVCVCVSASGPLFFPSLSFKRVSLRTWSLKDRIAQCVVESRPL